MRGHDTSHHNRTFDIADHRCNGLTDLREFTIVPKALWFSFHGEARSTIELWQKKMKESEDYSGELKCTEDVLSYRFANESWSVKISDIRLVGEYTTADGPFIDDYFLVFLTALEGGWYEASIYAQGRDEVLLVLSNKLGAHLETGLCNSAHYKTRIIWPEKWKGQDLLEVVPVERKKGLWNRVWGIQMPDKLVPSHAMREVFSK